jgi:hypothetical protein
LQVIIIPFRKTEKLTGNPKTPPEFQKPYRKSEKLSGNQKSRREFAIPFRNL